MTFALLVNVFGGLALFIYGMKLMSDGLNCVAGERMRSILRIFSSNRFVAVLSGTVVTAVIQSSSASTVMVIGFVNAGLLSLVQAIGIIFGANIGTTVTAQLVAFDISWIIMPSIILGLLLGFVPRRTIAGWGTTIFGLGLLFFGMELMSAELKQLSSHPAFMQAFLFFKCAPVDGWIPPMALFGAIGIGVVATMVIQSSSACSGIVIALGASGVIDLYTAVALILGSNIGTTVTAQLAALTVNRVAKQAALAHTLFNVLGVIMIVSTFWIILPGSNEPVFFQLVNYLSANGDLARRIANAHTIFNVCTTVVLIAFIPLLAKICEKVIPVGQEKVKFQKLEPHLLNSPEIALSQTVVSLRKMLKKSWKMFDCTLKSYNRNDERNQKRLANLDKNEDRVDRYQQDITEYLAQLMRRVLTEKQSERIPKLIHCTNDAERIGDHAGILRKLIEDFRETNSSLSPAAESEFMELQATLAMQARTVIDLLEHPSAELLNNAEIESLKLKEFCDQCESNHLKRLNEKECSIEAGMFYLELISEIRKVSHHLENISERSWSFGKKEIHHA